MDSILNQPKSTALLQPTKFQLEFIRLPDVQYFLKKFKLPGGSLQPLTQAIPFKSRPLAGNKLDYESLTIEFLLEEEMYSWEEIHDWLKNLGLETGFQDYTNLQRQSQSNTMGNKTPFESAYSDAMLTVLSTQNNPKIRFHFYDCFPISLGDIEFDTEQSAENVYTVEAEFGFHYYEMERIQG